MPEPGPVALADGGGDAPDSDEDDDGVEVECDHCGYEWTYSGEMWNATCPRCGRKTETGLKPDEFED